ncbi:hypothetical protein LDG_7647 [Legionella drancourtii LLAP12]|uniref:Uncharacterized protein n=1 Tax=Legionella drancourtii LLAP12 TaxID=658187 RepID=G9EQU4_9GAMM|nr:hypothetical protein LDG_7647 [Legionella drancourtii LLAP12]
MALDSININKKRINILLIFIKVARAYLLCWYPVFFFQSLP